MLYYAPRAQHKCACKKETHTLLHASHISWPEIFFELELPLRVGCNIEHLDMSVVLRNPRGSGHAKGLDGISKELLKQLGDLRLDSLNRLTNGILDSGDY